MSGSAATNNDAVTFEEKQAADAAANEAARQARLKSGMDAINTSFGGFDDSFYSKYNQANLDANQPDEERQYNVAKQNLLYGLTRQGAENSSVAGDKAGDLAYQDAVNKANIVSNANKATGDLQQQIQGNKEDIINQLYATEDPGVAASLAETSANASRLVTPTATPAAALFTPVLAGATTAASGILGPYSGGTGYNYAPQGATPAPATQSSGKVSLY